MSDSSLGAKGTEYGNWMSSVVFKVCGIALAVLLVLFLLSFLIFGNVVLSVMTGALILAGLAFTLWLYIIRRAFSYTGGRVMLNIQENLLQHLEWDGKGRLLDVGCGSAALSILAAKKYPEASVLGVDIWSPNWDYTKELCYKNANAEGVGERCSFEEGDATKLSFPDGAFDCVVSNFLYHEVPVKDKTPVILENLRVLRKGGAFALQDYFDRESMFGKAEALMAVLREEGFSEVHYEGGVDDKPWMPRYVLSPIVIKDIGVIWGRK